MSLEHLHLGFIVGVLHAVEKPAEAECQDVDNRACWSENDNEAKQI